MSKAKRYNPDFKKDDYLFKRGNFLYIFLVPLFIAIIVSLLMLEIKYFIANIITFGLFFATAKANSIGLAQELDYYTKTLTKAPKTPYKLIAGVLLGISTFFSAFIAGSEDFFISIFMGVIASIGYFLYYGFDPRRDKITNIGDISADFVIETLATARGKLKSIEEDITHIKDTKLVSQLRVAIDKAHEILKNIEEDPKDVRVARKFIIVYIDGIKKVTQSYIELDEKDITPETKAKLYNLLSDVKDRFEKEIIRLKRNNQFDLDVHIDVLQEQIKN